MECSEVKVKAAQNKTTPVKYRYLKNVLKYSNEVKLFRYWPPLLRKFNLPQEQLKKFYSAIIESVLCISITVWFSSATKSDLRRLRRVVRTAERIIGPTLPTCTVLIQSEQKGWQNNSEPLTSSTLPLLTITVWSTLQSSEHQNDQTQEQFLPSSNPSHEDLTVTWTHTTLLYIMYSSHIFISISNLHISYLYIHNYLYYILFCFFFLHCLFCIFVLLFLWSVSCPVAVFMLHWGVSFTITNSLHV